MAQLILASDELEEVVQYLNQSHYRFGLAPDVPRRGR